MQLSFTASYSLPKRIIESKGIYDKSYHERDTECRQAYEKCEKLGAGALSDTELLAVLLRTGTRGENALELASRILYHNGESGILGIHQFSIERLKKIHGVGRVKAVQLSCISELAKRLSKASAGELLSFENPDSIARYYMEDLLA